MDYRRLGDSGLKVSEIGLGCNNFGMRIDQAATDAVIDAAIEHGVTFFDTADVYGGRGKSEEMMGHSLKGKRHQVMLATKFAMPMGDAPDKRGGSRRYIMEAVEASLKRLQTDYLDLYQMHSPDADTPIEETLGALDDLVTQGKVRYIGNSNFAGWQIADADWTARTQHKNRFVSAQNNYSLLERRVEHEVNPACERFGLGMLPYFPLASGLLTGKYSRGEAAPEGTRLAAWGARGAQALNDKNFDKLEALSSWAAERGHDMLDLAFAWLLGHPVVSSVIAGATKPEQVAANAKTAAWKLTPPEVEEVTKLAA
jgi:aryl-alcohol dehydrogenase-like predicted oxidoreductase